MKNIKGGLKMSGGAPPTESKEYSFVQEMRTYAMKLHTREQVQKPGAAGAKPDGHGHGHGGPPPSSSAPQWQPSRQNYLQFLVDSLMVYTSLDNIIEKNEKLHIFRATGLERANALKEDIKWMYENDNTLEVAKCGPNGIYYSSFLTALAIESIPKFICHYYNFYFAHTAGGRMIGKRLADNLLNGKVLGFYQWNDDVNVLLDGTRKKIDAMANNWSEDEKNTCLEETASCFKLGGSLMVYISPPRQ